MDSNDLHPPDDYSHRFFIWHEWIQANGPLTSENVFEYFTTSMFYDKQSNNQVLRMQTMHTGQPIVNEAEELRRFTGVEFALVHSQAPSLFIIHKRERLTPDEVRPLTAYFIMNNRIYQSPDIYTVVSNRLLTAARSLQTSLDVLRSTRPDFTPRTGFIWPVIDPSAPPSTADGRKRGTTEEPETITSTNDGTSGANINPPSQNTNSQKQQNNMLLLNAMYTTAAHSRIAFSSVPATEAETDTDVGTSGQVSAAVESPASAVISGTKRSASVVAASPDPAGAGVPPKGALGGGKKKRKRTSTVQSPV